MELKVKLNYELADGTPEVEQIVADAVKEESRYVSQRLSGRLQVKGITDILIRHQED